MEQCTVNRTVQADLCCGCGVCKAVCPRNCISWETRKGLFVPRIHQEQCANCGLCLSVCPGKGHTYDGTGSAQDVVSGFVLACCNAWSRDPELRHVSASGGVVSTLIRQLLRLGTYDGAFCLDSYDYRTQMKTRLFTLEEIDACLNRSSIPKSRYLPISHENAVAYMAKNREAKLILIGTSCAVRGIQAAIQKLKLDRKQYLFIGLFCDQVFNYHVLPYFENTYSPNAPLEALHFKNKESGGWPGDMKLFPKGKAPFYAPIAERAKAKAYFMPECCLYCVDKLNVCADISLGDNYTGIDESKLGSNSVIIRTDAGADAWALAKESLEIRMISLADIQKAQYIEGRLNNLYYGDLKMREMKQSVNLNVGVPREMKCSEFLRAWHEKRKRLYAGAVYDQNRQVLEKRMRLDAKKPPYIVSFARRCYHYLMRKLMR